MTFKQLIQTNTWSAISPLFLKLYPDAEEDMLGYELVFNKLMSMDPEKTAMSIVIYKEKDGQDEYIDVSGLHNHPKNEEEKYPQGIELTPWPEWLGMDISEETLKDYSEPEILIHCLYEMTFAGFSEDDIPKALRKINKNITERDTMTKEESDAIAASVEELLSRWKS